MELAPSSFATSRGLPLHGAVVKASQLMRERRAGSDFAVVV
jgi:hypothetical protein